jgi:serine protease Do
MTSEHLSTRRRAVARALLGTMVLILGGCGVLPSQEPPALVDVIRRASSGVAGLADDRGVVGSGFRVAGTRWLVTAAHVVATRRGNLFAVRDRMRWPLRLMHTDADNDLALLELPADAALQGLELSNPDNIRQGDWVVLLGRPFGAGTTATVGIVSALPGAITQPSALVRRLQLNAAINPGNSGGPALDLEGRVVGVVSAAIPGGSGLGFAAPASAVMALVAQLP